MRGKRILLLLIAVVCFGVALSYPISYYLAQKSNNDDMDQLAAMRSRIQQEENDAASAPSEEGADANIPRRERVSALPDDIAALLERQAAQSDGDEPGEGSDELNAPGASGDEADQWAEWEDWTDEDEEEDVAPGVPQRPTQGRVSGAAETASPEAAMTAGQDASASPQGEASPTPGAEAPQASKTQAGQTQAPKPEPTPIPTPEPTPTPLPPPESDFWNLTMEARPTATPEILEVVDMGPTPVPEVTEDPALRKGPLPYTMKEKVEFDPEKMLPELEDIYALNHDLVGWITIPGTIIDYPVVQREDSEYYLSHDFYGEENINGQIILDPLCDPYTPSYNLIISGHHMKNGSMFGNLPDYRTKSYWEKHRFLEFDTLMDRQVYVIFAAFYSADYDENEKGFRYNANIVYKIDAEMWLDEVHANQLYDTGVDVEFGDEFITLTTCNRARHRNGRFVVVCRRIREGETFE